MERELTSKRIQFLKKDYSRGFIADVGYEAKNNCPLFSILRKSRSEKTGSGF
jgi:hypothetical protein